MFDVFYTGPKPHLFEFEQPADSLQHAAELSRTGHYWYIYGGNDYTGFDFDYQPVPWESHYTHVWPDQHQPNGNVYLTRDALAQHHYHTDQRVHRLGDSQCWYIPDHIDASTVDSRWSPDPASPAYIYHFPDQHQSASGVTYTVPGATDVKLADGFTVRSMEHGTWYIPDHIDASTVDRTWHPNVLGPAYIYHFPDQHQSASGVTYTVPGATDVKLADGFTVRSMEHGTWNIPDNIDPVTVDRTWHPNVLDPATNYHFPVQWNWDNIGGPVYRMPNALGDKYVNDFVARTKSNMDHWVIPSNINTDTFDFSWVPHPADPPCIYKFPTVWNAEGGPEYHVPGATMVKYMTDLVAETTVDMSCWGIPEEINQNEVDFSWAPHPKDPPYIYHFGTSHQQSVGLTYTGPGATELKFAGPVPVRGENRNVLEVLDVFFVDKNNGAALTRFERIQAKYPNAQKIRYANSMLDTIKRCSVRATTNKFWIISSEYNYDNFDFEWHALPWQSYMTHVFPSQHQKWSDTFLINRREFDRQCEWYTGIEQFHNLNFVNNQVATKPDNLFNIYYVDHGNDMSDWQYTYLRDDVVGDTEIVKTRFVDNYLDTFKRIMATAETEYVWIINSMCDYTSNRIDFTWEPEPWQEQMIHVFPTGTTSRGDTFYVNVAKFKEQMVEFEVLDFFNCINYCDAMNVDWFDVAPVYYDDDDLIGAIKEHTFTAPYAVFTTDICITTLKNPGSLWSPKDRAVYRFNESGSIAIVPRDIKSYLKTQIYDYPYISNRSPYTGYDTSLDIIFISNGEPDAMFWYEHTCNMSQRKVKWSKDINGRTAAYQAAADLSDTPWFFMVFAKLQVAEGFNFKWQPDYFQGPKHYIFNAANPLNGLEYGHMGMIAFNKKLVLENNTPGIDFTLSQPHEVVPISSGTAHFNQDPWTTWRTAFREVIKLKITEQTAPTIESSHRLQTWLTVANGKHSEWCLQGAHDAVEYFKQVDGDIELLKLSFEWDWLRKQFTSYSSL